ncbi:MAG: aminotransferase class I/II-fold pyridoxal phosphate-dependent enzyme [Kofleriaceae bacterium]
MRVETKLIHAGEPRPRFGGAIAMPIFQSSTYAYGDGDGGYHDIQYIRLNNTPNHVALHAKLAALEGTEAALVTASGMAAISATLLSLLAAGDHVLAHDGLYGGTFDLITGDLARLGITCTFVDASQPDTWKQHLRPTTRAFYVETITNPMLRVVALADVARFCRAHDLVSLIDNTMATPINFRPAEHGFDLVLHSATKYLNGHNDIVAGAVCGSAARVAAVKHKLDHLGGALDPHACFLLHRGLKTLALRMRHHNASALELAKFLAGHPKVKRVHHAGLPAHPDHARARELVTGYGGMVSFEHADGVDGASRFFARMQIPAHAPSLGGTETLATRPAVTSHAGMPAEARARQGITDALIRLSIGLESTEDLLEDFEQALLG